VNGAGEELHPMAKLLELLLRATKIALIAWQTPDATGILAIKERKIRMAKSKQTVCRSAISGKFVKSSYAKTHPKTTVKETVKK